MLGCEGRWRVANETKRSECQRVFVCRWEQRQRAERANRYVRDLIIEDMGRKVLSLLPKYRFSGNFSHKANADHQCALHAQKSLSRGWPLSFSRTTLISLLVFMLVLSVLSIIRCVALVALALALGHVTNRILKCLLLNLGKPHCSCTFTRPKLYL
jgi:hypothetical protein